MPKPITMIIDVEEIAFGKVWRALDVMPGVINIHMKGTGPPKLPEQKVATVKKNGKTTKRLVLESLLSKSPKAREELEAAIVNGGKQKTSLPDTLTKLKKEKSIRPIGKGKYKITAAGIKAATQED